MSTTIYIIIILITIAIREIKLISEIMIKKDLTFHKDYNIKEEILTIFKIITYNFIVIIVYSVLKDVMQVKYKNSDYIFGSIALFQLVLFTILVDVHKFFMLKKKLFGKLILSTIKDDEDKLYLKLKEVVKDDDSNKISNKIDLDKINKEVSKTNNNNLSDNSSSKGEKC